MTITFDILVQPRASRDQIGPRHDGRINVSVTAPPPRMERASERWLAGIDGEANAAVVELLARRLGVARRAVEVVAGEASRRKTIRVAGITADAVERLIAKPT